MNTKHTPGPWKTDPNYPGDVQDLYGNDLAVALRLEQNRSALFIRGIIFDTPTATANARLIAAAPVMYDLLKEVLKYETVTGNREAIVSLLKSIDNEQ